MKRIIQVEKFTDKNISRLCSWEITHLDILHEKLYTPAMDRLMVFVTRTGNMGIIWIIVAVFMIIFEPHIRDGYILLIALLLCVMIGNLMIKNIVRRRRPFFHKSYKLLIKQPWDYSFPSGHTLSSFAAATVICITNPYYGILAYLYAALIALSRLYLRVHFFTDVAFSSIVGIFLGWASVMAFKMGWLNFLPLLSNV